MNKNHKIILPFLWLAALSVLISCAIFHNKKTIIDPVSIVVIDESRIDNIRVRHIFEEFLVREIIHNGKNRVTVFVSDSSNFYAGLPEFIDYKVSFNVMDYGINDIMKQTDKVLASVKIARYQGNCAILSSFIESSTGNDLETMCGCVAAELSSAVVKKLISLHKHEFKPPDVYSEDEDSSMVQEQETTPK
jgi:hypothetical protein